MSILTAPLYELYINDATLVSYLEEYRSQSGTRPGVFTVDPVPSDAKTPYIVTAGDVVDVANDTKNSRGRDIQRDVKIYAAATGSTELIETIAERVRFLSHRAPLSINGYNWIISKINGPSKIDEPDYYGRLLTLSVTAREI